MKAKHFWIVIGVIGFGLMMLFSETFSLFDMSDNLHECAFVGFSIISLFGFWKVLSKKSKTPEIAIGTAVGILLVVLTDRGLSTMVVAVATAAVAVVLLLLLDKFVVKKYCSE